jgi:hypothetical protein
MITVTDGQLKIQELVIEDQDVVRYFQSIQIDDDLDSFEVKRETFLKAMKIGVIALERTQTQVNVDFIRSEFKDMQRQMQQGLEDIFREDTGSLAVVLNQYLGEGGKLGDLFDPSRKDSAIGQIQDIFQEHFGGDAAKLAKLLDYTEVSSPLQKLHLGFQDSFEKLEKQFAELREALVAEESRKKEREISSHKGGDFEDVLLPFLEDLIKPFGDMVEHVGTQTVDGRSKKGDLLITVNEQDTGGYEAKIVIEAKRDSGKSLEGKYGILQEIEDSMGKRDAQFAIAVFSDDVCPRKVGKLRAYPHNRLICSVSSDGSDMFALELAYRVVRTELCWQLQHISKNVDQAEVVRAVKYAREKLGQFRGIKSNATHLIKTAEGLRRQMDTIENEIRSELKSILVALKEPDEDEES